jgi:hypothetical protein
MFLGVLWALLLTLVTGFLAGMEYDRIRKIAARNRRLRREEQARKMKKARIQRHLESEQRKYAYMYNVAQNVPEGKR